MVLVGIDVGGTKVAFAAADDEGRIMARHQRPTALSGRPEDDVAQLAADVRKLMADCGESAGALRAVGVSVPGPIDRATGCVKSPPNLPGWDEVPVSDWLGESLGAPVRVENDANAAALAEWRFGAGRGVQDMAFLTMSTGVGCGLILGGRLYAGQAGTAGELGHIPVEWGGERCVCGLHGCLEAYAGGAAWARRLRELSPQDGRVCELAGGIENVTPKHLVAAAREGDAFALSELDRWNDHVARAIANLTMMLSPELVVLGTIARAAGEALCLMPIRERVARSVWAHQSPGMRIVASELGDELPYRAGVVVAMEATRESGGLG